MKPSTLRYVNRMVSNKKEKDQLIEDRMRLLRKTFQAGVRMLAGTDAGVPEVDFCDIFLYYPFPHHPVPTR